MKYLILSLHHTKENCPFFYLWKPGNLGYTRNVNEAGVYTYGPEKGETSYEPTEKHNTLKSMPIEQGGELYLKLQKQDDKEGTRILNNEYNCYLLGVSTDGLALKRGV